MSKGLVTEERTQSLCLTDEQADLLKGLVHNPPSDDPVIRDFCTLIFHALKWSFEK